MGKYVLLEAGKVYDHRDGNQYKCLAFKSDNTFVLERIGDRWTMEVHGVYMDEDGRIHWDYSTGGYFKCIHCENAGSVAITTSKGRVALVCEDCNEGYGVCDRCNTRRHYDELYVYNFGKGHLCPECYDRKDELE